MPEDHLVDPWSRPSEKQWQTSTQLFVKSEINRSPIVRWSAVAVISLRDCDYVFESRVTKRKKEEEKEKERGRRKKKTKPIACGVCARVCQCVCVCLRVQWSRERESRLGTRKNTLVIVNSAAIDRSAGERRPIGVVLQNLASRNTWLCPMLDFWLLGKRCDSKGPGSNPSKPG